jgi:CDGSH-type Zn-finger protein
MGKAMGQCRCGFTRDLEKNCDGTHKVVKAVKDDIINKIEAIEIEDSVTNAVGMKAMVIKVVKE